ncbi:MAG: hypothetical protein JJ900_17385 [Rhodospirillales bacterium]|nr:hypothetical protein [Rhodospirillales bacterium]MBO6788625.1 hypothetical protein [Rhodospirillales bacterium]
MTATQKAYGPATSGSKPIIKFSSAEEAWFWFIRTEKARAERAKAEQSAPVFDRPCLPDDIYSLVSRLHRKAELFDLHLEVMGEYGYLDRPPFAQEDDETVDWVIWVDAFDTLEPYLVGKGIVE